MNRPIVSVLMLIVLTALVLNSCRSYAGSAIATPVFLPLCRQQKQQAPSEELPTAENSFLRTD
ncbi:MAG: hypothetical protein IJ498_00400 [Akkermansia sp.]|nr:hypothetical protein [Akkermansia sp.]